MKGLWRTAAIFLSAVWTIGFGIVVGYLAYRRAACTPIVEQLPDGSIFRQACVHGQITWPTVLHIVLYCLGGVCVISLLSWIFLGPPSDLVARFFGYSQKPGAGRDRRG